MTEEERDSLYEQIPHISIYNQQFLLGIAFKVLQKLELEGADTSQFFDNAEYLVDQYLEGKLD